MSTEETEWKRASRYARRAMVGVPNALSGVYLTGTKDMPVVVLSTVDGETTTVLYGEDIDTVLMYCTMAVNLRKQHEDEQRYEQENS